MDRSPVAKVADAEAARRQQVGWIASHGASAGGELTTYWIRVGADRTWSVRPASSWEELKTQGQQLGALDNAIRAAVGAAFAANEDLVHKSLVEHNNELLRPVANLTLASSSPPLSPSSSPAAPPPPSSSPSPSTSPAAPTAERALAVTELSDLATLRLVAIDKPLPARQADYLTAVEKINAALSAAEPTFWRAVYYSGIGSGAYVHFLGADRPLTPAQLQATIRRALDKSLGVAESARLRRALDASLHRRELVPASFSPDLSTLPPPR